MKNRTILLSALLLCVVILLSSCGTVGIKRLVAEGAIADERPTLATAVRTELCGDVIALEGDLAVLRDNDAAGGAVTTVYNIATGAALWTEKDSVSVGETVTVTVRNDARLMRSGEAAWYMTRSESQTLTVATGKVNTVYTVSLHDGKGTQFAVSTDKNAMPETRLDLIRFEEKVYRMAEDGSVAYAFDMDRTAAFPAVTDKVGAYYYEIGAGAGAGVSIYDAMLNLAAFLNFPSYAQNVKINMLNGGNVLIQYVTLEPLTAKKYTYTENGNLYTLHSYLLEAESGKLKEGNSDYLIASVTARDSRKGKELWKRWGLHEDVENVADVFFVRDGRLDTCAEAMRHVILKNDGGIQSELELLKNDGSATVLERVAANRWIVTDCTGADWLVNEKGELLGEITALSSGSEERGSNYFVVDNMVYDWDLNEKYDLGAAGAVSVLLYMDHGILFENEDGDAILYNVTKGEASIVAEQTAINRNVERIVTSKRYIRDEWDGSLGASVSVYDYTYSSALFVIVDSSDLTRLRYEIYNDEGVRLTVLDSVAFDHMNCFVSSAEHGNAVLLRVTDLTGKHVYYRFG